MTTDPVFIGDDDPVTLDEACRLFFGGRLTKSALRTEARKGNLGLIRIANKDFVTRNEINRMVEKCRKSESPRDSTSGQMERSRSGSSETAEKMSAQDALRQRLKAQNKNSASTLPPNTSRSAAVLPLPSR